MTRALGAWAEELACRHLLARGLQLVTRNYRWRGGEIDLICMEGDTHVFVEVRLRRTAGYGSGAESVDGGKRARIARTASHYLQTLQRQDEPACRFDVISVVGGPGNNRLDWIKDAFQL